MNKQELEAKTVAELRAIAKEAGIAGISKLKKAELVDALAPAKESKKREIAEDGKYVKSKAQLKVEATIAKYEALAEEQGFLSPQHRRVLVNAQRKLENRGASKLFKFCQEFIADPKNEKAVRDMLGEGKFPETFGEFVALLPPKKRLFSEYDALGVMTKCNKKAALLAKSQKQDQGDASVNRKIAQMHEEAA